MTRVLTILLNFKTKLILLIKLGDWSDTGLRCLLETQWLHIQKIWHFWDFLFLLQETETVVEQKIGSPCSPVLHVNGSALKDWFVNDWKTCCSCSVLRWSWSKHISLTNGVDNYSLFYIWLQMIRAVRTPTRSLRVSFIFNGK